jgi:hypothetical protein
MKNIINDFINNKNIAMVGASQDKKNWGNMLLCALKMKGYTVYPVNPNIKEVDGEKCYSNVKELSKDITNVIIAVPPKITEQIVKECKEAGIKRVWMHKGGHGTGAVSEEAIKFCKENGIEVVYGLCPMMFFPPVGGHKVHFWIKSIFGTLPREFSK